MYWILIDFLEYDETDSDSNNNTIYIWHIFFE